MIPSRRRTPFFLFAVMVLLSPIAACSVTTPEIRARIVDSQTGEPQEWIKAIVYAGKTVHTLGGDVEHTLYTKTLYYQAKEGEVVIPSQSFTILDFVRYKDWQLIIKTPGHKLLIMPGKTVKALLSAAAGHSVVIKVEPYQFGYDWEMGHAEWRVSDYDSREAIEHRSNPSVYRRGLIEEYTWLLVNWTRLLPQRYGLSALQREAGPRMDVWEYLREIHQFCQEYLQAEPNDCLAVEAHARRLLNALPTDIQAQIGLEEFESKYPWLREGK